MTHEQVAPEQLVRDDDAVSAPRRPGPRRTALVVLPLLVGLAIAGGYGGRLLWQEVEDPTPTTGGVTCWDGSQTDSASDCTKPRGTDGLAWVFPSFRPAELDCVDELERNPGFNRPAMWTCSQQVGGRTISLTYSQVTGQRAAQRYFDKQYGRDARSTGRSPDGGSPVYTWAPSQTPAGDWETTLLLRDSPFSVTVSAESRGDAAKGMKRRVQVRPPDERRARPSGTDGSSTPQP